MFIITRFCIGITKKDYLDHRLRLLEYITLPSLMRQKNQDFRWLIIYDIAHPKSVIKALEKIISHYPNIDMIAIDPTTLRYAQTGNLEWVGQAAIRHILEKNYLDDIGQYVLWGIIDDDDAWASFVTALVRKQTEQLTHHPDMTTLHDYYSHQINSFCSHSLGATFTFNHGYSWLLTRDVLMLHEKAYLGHSCFLLTRFSSGLNALSCCHMNFESYFSHVNYGHFILGDTIPAWVYTRHNQSMSPYLKQNSDMKMLDMTVEKTARSFQKIFGVDLENIRDYQKNSKIYQLYDGLQPPKKGFEFRNLLPFYNRMHGYLQIMATCNQQCDALESALYQAKLKKNKVLIDYYQESLGKSQKFRNQQIKKFRLFTKNIKMINFNVTHSSFIYENGDPWE